MSLTAMSQKGTCTMLNFEEEIAKFRPSSEVEQAEDIIRTDQRDLTDLMMEILREKES